MARHLDISDVDEFDDDVTYKRRRWPAIVAAIIVALIIAGCVEAFLLFGSISGVKSDAKAAMDGMSAYVKAVKSGNQEELISSSKDVQDSSRRLNDELSSPKWVIASFVPVVGSDVRSVRTLSDVLVRLADEGLVPLANGTELMSLSKLMGEDSVNMDALGALSSVVRHIEPIVAESSQTVNELPPAHIEQIGAVLDTAREAVTTAEEALSHASPILGDLSTLLGADGQERRYLIVASNIGELHAAGGYVGSVGILTVTDGHFTMGDFGDIRNVLPFDSVSAGATSEEIALFGERVDTHHGDHNMIPDFSRVGQLYANIWETVRSEHLDGVIGVDPLFLQRVLALVGSVETSFGVTVDGTNAAAVIINECLFYGWQPTQCDDFYTEVAKKSFDKLLSRLGSMDTFAFLETLATSAEEGRCNVWVQEEGIEDHIKQAGLGWELPHDATKPTLGVFASDTSTSKVTYYLSMDTEVSDPVDNADGTKSYNVTTTFKHNFDPALKSENLTGYIVTGISKVANMRSVVEVVENVTLTAPEGGTITNVQSSHQNSSAPAPEIAWSEHTFQGLDTWRGDMYLDAGESCVITYEVTVAPEAAQDLAVRQTPVVPHYIRGD